MKLFLVITVTILISTLMALAINNIVASQEFPIQNKDQATLKTISHYAEKGFDEICITDELFTYCAIEQKKWKIWKNLSIKESTIQRYEMAIHLGYEMPPMSKKLIKSTEIMGNFTSYYNECALTIVIINKTMHSQNQMCSDSNQIFFDDLTKLMLVNGKEFLITVSPVYKIPPIAVSNGFGLDYFVESQKKFKHLVDTASTMDELGFISK